MCIRGRTDVNQHFNTPLKQCGDVEVGGLERVLVEIEREANFVAARGKVADMLVDAESLSDVGLIEVGGDFYIREL